MHTDPLTALLLDPFLTFGEAAKEFGATPPAGRRTRGHTDERKATLPHPRSHRSDATHGSRRRLNQSPDAGRG